MNAHPVDAVVTVASDLLSMNLDRNTRFEKWKDNDRINAHSENSSHD